MICSNARRNSTRPIGRCQTRQLHRGRDTSCFATRSAYLAHRAGFDQARLRDGFGHDLKRLLDESVELGLCIGPLTRTQIELLNEAHTKYWPRYPKQDAKPVFVIDQFEPSAQELFRAVSTALRPSIG